MNHKTTPLMLFLGPLWWWAIKGMDAEIGMAWILTSSTGIAVCVAVIVTQEDS